MQKRWGWAGFIALVLGVALWAPWSGAAARLPEAQPPPPASGPPITLDPGHGGIDGGATAAGVLEKDLNLTITREMARRLQMAGLNVVLTRETDIALDPTSYANDLRRRRDIAARNGSWAFVSIHVNSIGDASVRGTLVLYPQGAGPSRETAKALAQAVYEALDADFPNQPHRIQASDIPHLMESQVPAVLVEVGFISNAEDRRLLTNRLYQEGLAETLADAVREFRQNQQGSTKATG